MIAQFINVEFVGANAAADGCDQCLNLVVAQQFVESRFLDVEQFAADWQDRLEAAVASLFGGAAGGIPLDDVDFAFGGITFGAVGQFSGQ